MPPAQGHPPPVLAPPGNCQALTVAAAEKVPIQVRKKRCRPGLRRNRSLGLTGYNVWGRPSLKPSLTPSICSPSSLRANNLRIVTDLLQSTTRFIANERAYADPWKRQKMDDLVLMLQGAMAAEGKVGLMMNVPAERLEAVLSILPALQKPTVSSLSDRNWVAVNTILDESVVRHIVPQLKQAGAEGIVEYPLNKIID